MNPDAVARLFGEPIGISPIDWRSQLRTDHYAEHRDYAFLDLLDINFTRRPLAFF